MTGLEQKLSVYSQAMNLRTQRHQVLASNIANADTPNYKARDFDFAKAMQNAMAGRDGSLALATTANGHIGSGSGTPAMLQYRTETQSSVDGNTVDMDVERAQISENAIQYQVVSQLISETFKGMRTALSTTSG